MIELQNKPWDQTKMSESKEELAEEKSDTIDNFLSTKKRQLSEFWSIIQTESSLKRNIAGLKYVIKNPIKSSKMAVDYFRNPKITSVKREFSDIISYNTKNMWDDINIKTKEAEYLSSHETMSENEYNSLFANKESLQQWQLWNCYLVSWIQQLINTPYFDTLMRTSIQRVKWNGWSCLWYQITIPLWVPSWRKILIKDSELSIAKIRWSSWFKLLELVYAKNILIKNNRLWNKYTPITSSDLKMIEGWNTQIVLQTFLGENNINITKFSYPKLYKKTILNYIKHLDLSIWNRFVSLGSKTIQGLNDRKPYKVWNKTLYYNHAYSLANVNLDSKRNIKSLTVLNPRNREWDWCNYQDFTVDEFFEAFSLISCGTIDTKSFLSNEKTS